MSDVDEAQMKFKGSLQELQTKIELAGIRGTWGSETGGKHVFRCKDGGVLNWWESSGTIQCQGQPEARQLLASVFAGESGSVTGRELKQARDQVQIFIVHGHDMEARDQMELALRRLGLEPFVLMNSSGGGKTIIEALEGKIGRDFSSDFGIVLMTPDDLGYAKKDGAERAEPRSRQNVVLETGMLLASLTRDRMAIVVKGHLELPSDLEGIIRFGYNERVREIVPKLCQRLKEAGFELSAAQIAAAAQ